MKLIAFGCSFTNYVWPTYADVLKADNIGMSGAGNERIFYEVLKHYKNQRLFDYDGIIVQWSGHNRFDYLTRRGWNQADGAIMFSETNRHIWKNIKSWYNEDYELEKTHNYIYTVDALLKQANKKTLFMSMDNIDNPCIQINHLQKTHEGYYEFDTGEKWINGPFVDTHPTIDQHLGIAKICADYFNLQIDQHTERKCNRIHQRLLKENNFRKAGSYKL